MIQTNGTLRSHAQAYLDAGLCVLPAIRDGDTKRPALAAWKPYQERLPTPDEISDWFTPQTSSMCLVCGAVSGHLEMIDFDLGGAKYEPWREAVEAQAPGLLERLVIETTPSGGRHAVYRCEEPVSGNIKLAIKYFDADNADPLTIGAKDYVPRRDLTTGEWFVSVTLIETRGEGGLFLCAPSPGYELLQGDLADPPVLSAAERDILLGCAWALDETPRPIIDGPGGNLSDSSAVAQRNISGSSAKSQHEIKPGADFNANGDIRELLIAHGWRLVREGDNEHWCRPGKPAGTSATLKDGVFYVFSSNAPPFEPHKGYSRFAVCALLEHGGDFTRAASALATQGYGVADTQGVDLSQFMTSTPELGLKMRSVRELVADFPQLRKPVIHGLLRQGETMNIIAATKANKSWLSLDLAIAVATGTPWLGQYPTEAGEVLIIDNELHPETSAFRTPRVATARGVPINAIDERVFVLNLRGQLKSILDLKPFLDALEPGRFKIIVLDAWYRFMPAGSDENDNASMANIYNTIDAYADRLGCCFVVIHHTSKGGQASKAVTDVGAGAGSQSRAVDTHLVLRPHEEDGVVVLDAAVRSWPPIEPACFRWEFPVWQPDPALDPADLRVERPKKKEKEKPVETKAHAWTVERFVEAFIGEEPVTLAELRVKIDREPSLSWRRAGDLLDIAEAQGDLHRWSVGRAHKAMYATRPQPDQGEEES